MNYRELLLGNNRYGGQFTYDQSHDAPPVWNGVSGPSPLFAGWVRRHHALAHLSVQFLPEVWARITDGVHTGVGTKYLSVDHRPIPRFRWIVLNSVVGLST